MNTRTPAPQPVLAGEKPKTEPRHTHHEPQPGLAGCRRSAHTNTHTTTPQPGIFGRSQNPIPSADTHTATRSQEWRGTSRARTQKHTPQHPSQDWRDEAETQNPDTHTHSTHPSHK